MEIDHHHHLKSGSPEEEEDQQRELMLMMDKIPPEFYNEITDLTSSPPPPHHDFPTTYNTISHFLETNNHLPFINHLSSPPPPPPLHPPPHFLSNTYPPQHPHQKSKNSMAVMREMIFRIAAMQPIHIDPESVKPPKRRNVKISKDPQSVAARHRRERISERIRILQRLVPGGTKMDTASMLDEAIHYVKFLKTQVQSLERAQAGRSSGGGGGGAGAAAPPPPPPPAHGIGFPVAMSSGSYLAPLGNHTNHHHNQNVQSYGDAN